MFDSRSAHGGPLILLALVVWPSSCFGRDITNGRRNARSSKRILCVPQGSPRRPDYRYYGLFFLNLPTACDILRGNRAVVFCPSSLVCELGQVSEREPGACPAFSSRIRLGG